MSEYSGSALVIGASRGIGAATAHALHKSGYRTAGTHRTGGSVPDGVVPVEMDIRDTESINRGVKDATEALGGLEVLVVAAGITRDKLLLRMSEEDITDVMQVNTIGPMLACKAALGPMMKQRAGSIVLVSSMSAKYGVAGQCNYTASKGALEAFARSMAREYASRNIRVNVIAPGTTETDMMASTSEEVRATMIAQIPLKRMGTPDEVASAIIHTAENTYMTGAVVPVAGGI